MNRNPIQGRWEMTIPRIVHRNKLEQKVNGAADRQFSDSVGKRD